MIPRLKKMADKPSRKPSPEQLEFAIPEHQACFEHLLKLKFGPSRFPDLSALREIQLANEIADEVKELLSVGSLCHLLFIRKMAIRTKTLEVLALFKFARSYSSFRILMLFSFVHTVSTTV